MLDELVGGDAAVELVGGEEVVVDAVALAGRGSRVVAEIASTSPGMR